MGKTDKAFRKLRPLGNRILCVPIRPQYSPGGIKYAIDPFFKDIKEFRVCAMGPGERKADGTYEPINLVPGFRVVTTVVNAARFFEFDGYEYAILKMSEVAGVMPP